MTPWTVKGTGAAAGAAGVRAQQQQQQQQPATTGFRRLRKHGETAPQHLLQAAAEGAEDAEGAASPSADGPGFGGPAPLTLQHSSSADDAQAGGEPQQQQQAAEVAAAKPKANPFARVGGAAKGSVSNWAVHDDLS